MATGPVSYSLTFMCSVLAYFFFLFLHNTVLLTETEAVWFLSDVGIMLVLDGIGKKNFNSHVYISGAIIKDEIQN